MVIDYEQEWNRAFTLSDMKKWREAGVPVG
jgi:hypothetical protein